MPLADRLDVDHLVHEHVGAARRADMTLAHAPVSPENTTEPPGVSKR